MKITNYLVLVSKVFLLAKVRLLTHLGMSFKNTSFYNAAKSNQNGTKLKFAMFLTSPPFFNQLNFSYIHKSQFETTKPEKISMQCRVCKAPRVVVHNSAIQAMQCLTAYGRVTAGIQGYLEGNTNTLARWAARWRHHRRRCKQHQILGQYHGNGMCNQEILSLYIDTSQTGLQ